MSEPAKGFLVARIRRDQTVEYMQQGETFSPSRRTAFSFVWPEEAEQCAEDHPGAFVEPCAVVQ